MNGAAAAGDLAAARSADLATRLRACPESVSIDDGWVVRDGRLAAVHQLNAIVLGTMVPLDPAAYDGDAIERLARRWQADLPDRCVVIDDERTAERLAVDLPDRGWERQRTLFMALRSDPAAAVRDSRARKLDEDELRALQLACLRQEVIGPSVPHELPASAGRCPGVAAGDRRARFGSAPGNPARSPPRVARCSWTRTSAAGESRQSKRSPPCESTENRGWPGQRCRWRCAPPASGAPI